MKISEGIESIVLQVRIFEKRASQKSQISAWRTIKSMDVQKEILQVN